MSAAPLPYLRLGWRLHPIVRRQKEPLLAGWPARASADRTTVRGWLREFPDCNWAVACGPESGVFVLDVDGPEGDRALAALEREHGPLPDAVPLQLTGSGRGWQGFFAYPVGRDVRNRVLGPKLETRGARGYALLPPSVHPSGRRYAWAADRGPWGMAPPPAPAWLLDLLDPPRVAPSAWRGRGPHPTSRYVAKAFAAELELLAGAPSGRRNTALNSAAFAVLRFVADRELSAGLARDGLLAAARHCGLPERETLRTIKSAADARGIEL